eukprot:EG_transcript_48915
MSDAMESGLAGPLLPSAPVASYSAADPTPALGASRRLLPIVLAIAVAAGVALGALVTAAAPALSQHHVVLDMRATPTVFGPAAAPALRRPTSVHTALAPQPVAEEEHPELATGMVHLSTEKIS